MSQLSIKLADEIRAFLRSPIYGIIRYRILNIYHNRLRTAKEAHTRAAKWPEVSILQGKMDAIPEIVEILERLDVEIQNGVLNVDEALNVIENK